MTTANTTPLTNASDDSFLIQEAEEKIQEEQNLLEEIKNKAKKVVTTIDPYYGDPNDPSSPINTNITVRAEWFRQKSNASS